MIAVIQRVLEASVQIVNRPQMQIGKGLLVLVGIEEADGDEDAELIEIRF